MCDTKSESKKVILCNGYSCATWRLKLPEFSEALDPKTKPIRGEGMHAGHPEAKKSDFVQIIHCFTIICIHISTQRHVEIHRESIVNKTTAFVFKQSGSMYHHYKEIRVSKMNRFTPNPLWTPFTNTELWGNVGKLVEFFFNVGLNLW